MLPDANITALIPQQQPFVMIDELLYADNKIVRTRFRIDAVNVLTENGRFTEAGLIENIAQTAAAGAGYRAKMQQLPVNVGYITVVKNLVIEALPVIGQELITEIEIHDQIFNTTMITGRIRCNEQQIASCEMNILIQQFNQTSA